MEFLWGIWGAVGGLWAVSVSGSLLGLRDSGFRGLVFGVQGL